LSLRFDILWRKRLARRFRELLGRPNARVLDVCCGTGDLTLALAAEARSAGEGPHAMISGADFAHPMVVRAQEKAQARTSGVSGFLEADAMSLPFADESFDLITVAFGFRNLANYRAGLAELHRTLRPGGCLAILEFSEPRSALFGGLFRYYFHSVLPRIGARISGNRQAYSYLPRSVARFPEPPQLAHWMEEAGYRLVRFERWTGGIVALHIGCRESGTPTISGWQTRAY